MGRHAAHDGAGVDPIVAAALSRRPTVLTSPPRHGDEAPQRVLTAADGDGGLGWPGEPADGTGLGWPTDLDAQRAGTTERQAVALVPDVAPVRRRSGWRRIFGGGQSSDRGAA